MSISKIHLFSKDTDAFASARGYEYQKLKSLESWVQNGVNQIDEQIYCEYEEDIFHRNAGSQKSKFRQLKLYSSNFSFSSEEIKKAIIHFFDLYTKGDYLFDDVTFIFETNVKVAKEYQENEAKLLKEWFDNQEALELDIIGQCAEKVKTIVYEYFSSEYAKVLAGGTVPNEIEEGFALFKNLKQENWIAFIKCIKWKFDGITPEQAMVESHENIKRLILRHPHYTENDNISAVVGALYLEVSNKTIEKEPENRKLTIDLLDKLMLEQGSEDDKWYSGIYEQWNKTERLDFFSIGEFFAVIDGAKHCRRNKPVWKHSEIWINLLEQYYVFPNIDDYYKKKCVYEIVWLKLKTDPETLKSDGALTDIDDKLKFYFSELEQLDSIDEIEDALNIVNILLGTSRMGMTGCTVEEVDSLAFRLYKKIEAEILKADDLNKKCNLLEFVSTLRLSLHGITKGSKVEKIFEPLYEIIEYLDRAALYDVTQLSRRINKMIKMFIRFGGNDSGNLIEKFEFFLVALDPYVVKRDGNFKAAKTNIERGAAFLFSERKDGRLKSLNYFHTAKDLYLSDTTMEGYVLGTLNIAQLYSSFGFNFAAKYYALTSLWISLNNKGDNKLLKRIPQAFGLLFHLDFKQGAWFSAIATFNDYLFAKRQFDSDGFDFEKDTTILKMFSEMALIIHSTECVSAQMTHQLEFIKSKWGIIWDENIKYAVEHLEKEVKLPEGLKEIIENKLDDAPLNDVGKNRVIRWNALGSEWEIQFENTAVLNSLAEEYCAILQICLAEIALSGADFHLIRGKIKIHIEQGTAFEKPEQAGDNSVCEYKIVLPQLIAKDIKEINHHHAYLAASLSVILSDLSLLKWDEFQALFNKLFSEQGLAQKTYTVNTFQRIYRELYNDALFAVDQRSNYRPVNYQSALPIEDTVLKWEDSISEKYDEAQSLKFIKNRYDRAYKVIHLTIDRLKSDEHFKEIIKDLRKEGWRDWQIILTIMNFVVNYKVSKKLGNIAFPSGEERAKAIQKGFHEMINIDESENPVEFPAKAFETDEFKTQFNIGLVSVLQTWELESHAILPNLKAIRDFLNIRFRFNIDDLNDGNLLRDI